MQWRDDSVGTHADFQILQGILFFEGDKEGAAIEAQGNFGILSGGFQRFDRSVEEIIIGAGSGGRRSDCDVA